MLFQTKIRVEEAYYSFIGGYYNSMLDGLDDDLLEVKEILMDTVKIVDYVYKESMQYLKSYEKNIKFDGTKEIKKYINLLILNDIDDIIELQNYVSKL